MMALVRSLGAEWLKVGKSKALLASFAISSLLPLIMTFMIFALKKPELAHNLGLLGTKARLMGKADWPSFFDFLAQGTCGLEIVLFGFIGAWVFGREYAGGTLKDILTLPIPKPTIAFAKLIVVAIWCLAIFLFIYSLSMLGAYFVELPLWNETMAINAFFRMLLAAVAFIYLNSVVAFIACYSGGYLASVGFVIVTAVFINFTGVIGFGEFYPWAIPMYYAAGTGDVVPGGVSWIIVALVGTAGVLLTTTWWLYGDQK